MKLLKKDKMIYILILIFMIIVTAIISMFLITKKEYNQYVQQVNDSIANLIGMIKENYPNVKEEDIIRILNNTTKKEVGQEIMKKYGISIQEASAIQVLEKQYKENIKWNISFVLILIISILLIVYYYIKWRDKKINKLTKQIQKINNHEYSLQIKDNTEDELSNLRNELYKITIMLKEQAENSKTEKESLAMAVSDISHQLKTPLTSISIMLDNINENEEMEEETKRKFLHEIRRQIEWINWLIIALLKMAKLDADAVIFKEEKIMVKEIIEQAIMNLAIPIEVKNITIKQEGKQEISFIGDRYWQLEAIINIIKNCIEHTPENKKIKIKYSENHFYTKIEIQDEGEGIKKKDLPHIFERFYKGENATENSVGIGLALAKTIIEKGKGQIYCSSYEKKGTTFEIRYMKWQ